MKILFVRNDHLGDLVLSLPVVAAVQKALPEAEVHLLTAEALKEIPSLLPGAVKVRFQNAGESIPSLASRLSEESYDIFLSFPATKENARLARMLRIPLKIGHASKPYNWFAFNRFVSLRRSHPPVHETEFMLAFVRKAGIPAELDPEWSLDPSRISGRGAPLLEQILPECSGFITIHPGSRGSAENLSFESWIALTKDLARVPRTIPLFILGPEETDLEKPARHAFEASPNVRVVTGCSLPDLAGILSLADLTVSASTGPMHLAAALGTPTYSFFSSRLSQSPEKWRPIGCGAVIDQALPGRSVNQIDLRAAAGRITDRLVRQEGTNGRWSTYRNSRKIRSGA